MKPNIECSIEELIERNGMQVEDDGNPWLAYERYKNELLSRGPMPHWKYEEALQSYIDYWKI